MKGRIYFVNKKKIGYKVKCVFSYGHKWLIFVDPNAAVLNKDQCIYSCEEIMLIVYDNVVDVGYKVKGIYSYKNAIIVVNNCPCSTFLYKIN